MQENLRILIVDDDEVDRMALKRALTRAGLRMVVQEVDHAAAAIQLLEEEEFDCAFLDYQLPGGDGLTVLRQVRAAGVETPIVMLTGQGDEQVAVELMKAGATDYVPKSSLSPDRVGHSVQHAVRVHQAELHAQHAEEALRLSEERFRSLVAATSQIIWTMDATGSVVTESAGWTQFTGQSWDELQNGGWIEAVHPQDRALTLKAWEEAIEDRGLYEVEHRLRHVGGEYRHMQVRGVPILEPDGTIREWVGAHTDITRRKKAEEEREAAVKARSRFYAAMSHELRTPINAIMGYNDLLLGQVYGSMTEQQTLGVQRAQNAAKHLLELVNDVLDLSKLEAGKMDLQIEKVNLHALIDDLFITIRPLAEENACGLELVSTSVCPEDIETDPRRVRQILLNLLSNAIKFGACKPVEVRCVAYDDNRISIEVADRGIGIAEADLPRIFEEFVQIQTSSGGGTGLGLPISKRLAELLGGDLEAESTPGQGSTFRLVLPKTLQVTEEVYAEGMSAAST